MDNLCKFARKKYDEDNHKRCYAFGDNTGYDYIACEGNNTDKKRCPLWHR